MLKTNQQLKDISQKFSRTENRGNGRDKELMAQNSLEFNRVIHFQIKSALQMPNGIN